MIAEMRRLLFLFITMIVFMLSRSWQARHIQDKGCSVGHKGVT